MDKRPSRVVAFFSLIIELSNPNMAGMSAAGPRHRQGGGVGAADRGRHLREGVAGGGGGPAQARQRWYLRGEPNLSPALKLHLVPTKYRDCFHNAWFAARR